MIIQTQISKGITATDLSKERELVHRKSSIFPASLRQDLRTILVCICMHKYSQVLTLVNAEAWPLCLDSTSALISKRAVKEDSSILCFQHTLIMPFRERERDASSLLQPTTASHVCILMSINYTLNETIKNCRAIDVCVPSLEE